MSPLKRKRFANWECFALRKQLLFFGNPILTEKRLGNIQSWGQTENKLFNELLLQKKNWFANLLHL